MLKAGTAEALPGPTRNDGALAYDPEKLQTFPAKIIF
jgi:hypothetical protein